MTNPNPTPPLHAPPADPPRAVTPRGNLRAWSEPRVRTWWLLAALLTATGVYFVAQHLTSSLNDRWLIQNGQIVPAAIVEVNGIGRKGYIVGPEDNPLVKMQIELNGQKHLIEGRLPHYRKSVTPEPNPDNPDKEKLVRLFVDPQNPNRWTDRQYVSLGDDLLVGILAVPSVCILLAIAVWQHIRVVRVWRFGQAMQAVVVDTRQAPSAPLSRIVRFTLADSRDRRLFKVTVPTKHAHYHPGDPLWIIAPPTRPDQAIVAGLYEENVR